MTKLFPTATNHSSEESYVLSALWDREVDTSIHKRKEYAAAQLSASAPHVVSTTMILFTIRFLQILQNLCSGL
jgi:hypothetical protein